MTELTDSIWKELEGGYKTPFDASILLTRMERTTEPNGVAEIWNELWDELHHQGDVGLASYLSVPQLVRIGISKELVDWNLMALCSVIEQQRHLGNNPTLPKEFEEEYQDALKKLKEYAIQCLNKELDNTTLITALSTIATCEGKAEIGKVILEIED